MKKLLLLLFLIPNLVLADNVYPKSCKKLPAGFQINFPPEILAMNDYESAAIHTTLTYEEDVEFSPISYDLNDDGDMEIFVEVQSFGYCGSAGCAVNLLYMVNDKWEHQYFVPSANTISITSEIKNGYKVIYTKSRDYGVIDPDECPYRSQQCMYDKKAKSYKCSNY